MATFQRIYPDSSGPECTGTPENIDRVLRSMNENAGHAWNSFRVLVRQDDGTTVLCKPKRRRPA